MGVVALRARRASAAAGWPTVSGRALERITTIASSELLARAGGARSAIYISGEARMAPAVWVGVVCADLPLLGCSRAAPARNRERRRRPLRTGTGARGPRPIAAAAATVALELAGFACGWLFPGLILFFRWRSGRHLFIFWTTAERIRACDCCQRCRSFPFDPAHAAGWGAGRAPYMPHGRASRLSLTPPLADRLSIALSLSSSVGLWHSRGLSLSRRAAIPVSVSIMYTVLPLPFACVCA